jgi:hypothetical protein
MRSLISRTFLAGSVAIFASTVAAGLWSGCASESESSAPPPDTAPEADAIDDTRVQVIDVRDDAGTSAALCGDEQLCDPDIAAICTPLSPDAGADTGATDAVIDGSTASTAACRVVKRENKSIAACAPAGKVLESQFCASDDECAPGLACVGVLGRCLRYCCTAWSSPTQTPDAGGGTHYCTPRPLTARPSEKVPVWVKLDNCTLLDDALQCLEGTTCTVVTNDGRTTCVQAGTGRDYASCAEDPCDRGYVCLGTTERLCRKLCREAEGPAACPSGGYCQRVPTIPEGYGICTGGDAGTK